MYFGDWGHHTKNLQISVTTEKDYRNLIIYIASQEIGLSQAYDTNPAWAAFTFYITFSTKGSHAEDEEYLQQVFNFASALVTYYKMKE